MEIDLALMFSEMALTADDKAKAARNAGNAQRGYDAATHFLEDDGLSRSMKANVRRKENDQAQNVPQGAECTNEWPRSR